ncbi:hypothetical protein SCANM63S_09582 [Streptomyces canarius]
MSFEFSTYPARLSDAERDQALRTSDGVAIGRLSHDTFVRRMELALVAREPDELAALVADLPRENRFSRAVLGTVEAVSGFTVRLRRAWQAERLQASAAAPGAHPSAAHRPRSRERAAAEPRDRRACTPNSATRAACGS